MLLWDGAVFQVRVGFVLSLCLVLSMALCLAVGEEVRGRRREAEVGV